MAQPTSERVLGRLGARSLSEDELKQVNGGLNTGRCTFDPTTCVMDHDCSPPPGC